MLPQKALYSESNEYKEENRHFRIKNLDATEVHGMWKGSKVPNHTKQDFFLAVFCTHMNSKQTEIPFSERAV